MYCRATEAWGRFWRRNKETSSSQRLCQQQEAASLQRPTGLVKLPCLAKLRAEFQLPFHFSLSSTGLNLHGCGTPDPSIAARTDDSLFFSHYCILQQRLSRSSYDPDNSSFRQRPSAASRDCGSCRRRDVHRLLFIRRPPFLSPTVTNALPTYFFSGACSGTIEATQLELWR